MNTSVARRARFDRSKLQDTLRTLVDDGILTRADAEQILRAEANAEQPRR